MATGVLFLNDRDVQADFSLIVTELSGWPGMLGSAPRDVPLLDGPEMSGAIIDSRLIRRRPGTASARGIISAATPSAALTALDALRGLVLTSGEVAVKTAYASDRYAAAVCTGFDGGAENPSDLNGRVSVVMTFVIKDGLALRNSSDGIALSAAAAACPIGTAESRPVITINGGGGALTNPVITVRNSSGTIVQTMGFTVSLAAADQLSVDSARSLATLTVAGVPSDALAAGYWTSGDFPVLRPYDGWVEAAQYPTVALSSSTGTPVGLCSYTRGYL